MALENFKQNASQKAEKEILSKELGDRFIANRQNILESLADEFLSFLKAEGFSVSRQGNVLKADYSGVQLALEMPDATASFFGCLSVLVLKDSRNPRDNWSLVILEGKGRQTKPRISISMRSDNEEEKTAKDIQELKERLATWKPMEYSIMYYRNQDSYGGRGGKDGPIVTTLTEALTAILEK